MPTSLRAPPDRLFQKSSGEGREENDQIGNRLLPVGPLRHRKENATASPSAASAGNRAPARAGRDPRPVDRRDSPRSDLSAGIGRGGFGRSGMQQNPTRHGFSGAVEIERLSVPGVGVGNDLGHLLVGKGPLAQGLEEVHVFIVFLSLPYQLQADRFDRDMPGA